MSWITHSEKKLVQMRVQGSYVGPIEAPALGGNERPVVAAINPTD